MEFSKEDRKICAKLFHKVPNNNDLTLYDTKEAFTKGIIFINKNGKLFTNLSYDIISVCVEEFGVSELDWSNSFHKNWDKVENSSDLELAFEQAMHYFSTYGLESLGLEAKPFIPVEKIIVDENKRPNFKAFTIITVVSEEDIKEEIKIYLKKTISPHKNLIKDIIKLMEYTDISVDDVASFELKIARCAQLDTVPTSSDDFLRYIVYKVTGSTLLIKNEETINKIKSSLQKNKDFIKSCFEKANLDELSKYFYRFKPLWLAFKSYNGCAPYINKMRRLAKINHKPIKETNVQNIIKLWCEDKIDEDKIDDITNIIKKSSNRQLIKLWNHILYLIYHSDESYIYNIRNGKIWIEKNQYLEKKNNPKVIIGLYSLLMKEIAKRFENKFKDKIYFIPSYIHYAVPYSEKHFIGNIPYGTNIDINMDENIFAIYWKNQNNKRIDLDLHLNSYTEHYGWNGDYRSTDKDILYSGDMTDATKGAVEAFKVKHNYKPFVLTVNDYSGIENIPFSFFITEQWDEDNKYRYNGIVNIENAIFPPISLKFSTSYSQSIGLISKDKFYFYGGELGMNKVPKKELYSSFLDGISCKLSSQVDMAAFLSSFGATIVDEKELENFSDEEQKDIIDLSPSALTSSTLLDMID